MAALLNQTEDETTNGTDADPSTSSTAGTPKTSTAGSSGASAGSTSGAVGTTGGPNPVAAPVSNNETSAANIVNANEGFDFSPLLDTVRGQGTAARTSIGNENNT